MISSVDEKQQLKQTTFGMWKKAQRSFQYKRLDPQKLM